MDYRHPGYFADLWVEVSKLNIRDQIVYLGLVPHDDVLMLMRQSVCVLNPSLFEGWGMTVEEARSLGKRVILSNISTHHEQKVPKAVFFDPMDYEDLASKLAEMWQDTPPGPDLKLEQDAKESLSERIETNAKSFMRIVREVVN
jgi:glycosyltransferase involved in cell wall biosynthesis